MKPIAIGFAIATLSVTAFVTWNAWPPNDPLALGSLIILSLTLIVLIVYAYDTNSIARVTRERWQREGVLSTTYSMELIGTKGQAGKTLFRLHNQSTLLVRATVACNFRVYGEAVSAGDPYDGKDVWLLFPHQVSQGWFEVEMLLQAKGKSVALMMAEWTPGNATNQLTMALELSFEDELGGKRKLPAAPPLLRL